MEAIPQNKRGIMSRIKENLAKLVKPYSITMGAIFGNSTFANVDNKELKAIIADQPKSDLEYQLYGNNRGNSRRSNSKGKGKFEDIKVDVKETTKNQDVQTINPKETSKSIEENQK